MRTLVAWLLLPLVLMLAGCARDAYGISAAAPLGRLEAVSATLKEKGLERKDVSVAAFRARLDDVPVAQAKGLEGVEFIDHSRAVTGIPHYVLVVHAKGRIVAVRGGFYSGAANFSTVGAKSESFVAKYWLEMADGEPAFAKQDQGGRYYNEYLEARVVTPERVCIWVKNPSEGRVSQGSTIIDDVVIHLTRLR